MKIVIAFYGYYEHVSLNQVGNVTSSWKLAWPFFEKNVYKINSQHEVQTVFHTWIDPSNDLLNATKPVNFIVEAQTEYSDRLINDKAKHHNGYKNFSYNNLKNRLHSMKESVRLASELNPDIIILSRFDCVINFPMKLQELNLNDNDICAANWNPPQPLAVVDHYYVANLQAMKKFVDCYELFDHTIFDNGTEYTDWLRDVNRLHHDWTISHLVIRWFLDVSRLNYVHYGTTDVDTCVTRQLSRFKFKS